MAIDEKTFPNYLILDNDGIYGNWIVPVLLEYFDIKVLRINKRAPWENGKIERYWLTLQKELIFRLPIQNEASLRYFCKNYQAYYNNQRPHQGIDGRTPVGKCSESSNIIDLSSVRYEKKKHLHGLFTKFRIVA